MSMITDDDRDENVGRGAFGLFRSYVLVGDSRRADGQLETGQADEQGDLVDTFHF